MIAEQERGYDFYFYACNLEQEIERHVLDFEMRERNAESIKRWQLRKALGVVCIDTVEPAWRVRLNAWFDEQRNIALRWLFKHRCEKRNGLRMLDGVGNQRMYH